LEKGLAMTNTTAGLVLGAVIAATAATAAPADHYTIADLDKAAAALKAKAAASGSASDTLATYANHHTMLAFRTQDGTAEVHTRYADVFYIVRGKATLLTEGALDGSHEEGPGELRGTAVTGGKRTELKEGDVVHIPAGTPHQLLVAKGGELLYFVIKIKEHD
jgi:mannose-6-phosphate isomerase-like protein (cupin superfamily)